jgi:hypothetical protein
MAQVDQDSGHRSKDSEFTKGTAKKRVHIYSNTPQQAKTKININRSLFNAKMFTGKSSKFKKDDLGPKSRKSSHNRLNQSMNHSIIDPVFLSRMR